MSLATAAKMPQSCWRHCLATGNRKEAKAIAIQFSDRAEEYGLRFTPVNGQSRGHLSILESLGTGVGVIDFDADGDLDVFFPGGGDFAIDPLRPVGLHVNSFAMMERVILSQ